LLSHPGLVLLGRPASVYPVVGSEVIDIDDIKDLATSRVNSIVHDIDIIFLHLDLLLDLVCHRAIVALLALVLDVS
jgi:hypothetical protein